MPETVNDVDIKTCTNEACGSHGDYLHIKFCDKCGSEVKSMTIKRKSHLNLGEFLEKELDNEDLFTPVYPDDVDFILVIPNCEGQGGTHFEDSVDTEVFVLSDTPEVCDMAIFDQEDWKRFIQVLVDKTIKYERKVGILRWYC
jgi:hypothetical protein